MISQRKFYGDDRFRGTPAFLAYEHAGGPPALRAYRYSPDLKNHEAVMKEGAILGKDESRCMPVN